MEIKNIIYLAIVAMVGIAGLFAFSTKAEAAVGVNSQISFQGKLVNPNGTNIANGTYNLRFKIYQDGTNTGSGGTLRWTETRQVNVSQGVAVTAGTFQVNLGSVTPFGAQVDWNQDTLWLSMEVGGTSATPVWDGEMTPFIRMTAVPYAQNANSLDGLDSTAFSQLATNNAFTGNVSVSGVTSATKFSVGNLFNVDTANSRVAVGGAAINYSKAATGGTLNLAAASNYPTATGPAHMALGDLDGDGDNDMAIAGEAADRLSILLNEGGTVFGAKVDYVTDDLPRGVVIGDIDGDGDKDVIVSVVNTIEISVFKNNGNGTFAAKVDYPTGTWPHQLDLADIDGDGDLDVATSNAGANSMSVLKNNGNGTYATKVDYPTGNLPDGAAFADYDGDGDQDVAISNEGSASISVFKNNGDGTYAAKVDRLGIANGPKDIISTDFDGDGDFDIGVVSNTATNNMAIMLNNGDATFAAPVNYSALSGPESLAAADMDGDGDKDIAIGTNSGVSVFLNTGSGAFGSRTDYTAGTTPFGIAMADLDGDGDVGDVAVTNEGSSTVSIIRNNTTVVAGESSTATASVTASNATSAGLFVKGVAGQTASYFRILNSAGNSLLSVDSNGQLITAGNVSLGGGIFSVDTGGSLVRVGPLIANGVGTVLILDDKNTTGDPTGDGATNGAMYYNSNLGKFRCREAGAWVNCIATADKPTMIVAANVTNTTTTFADVPGLTTTVESGKTYNFICDLFYTSAATTTALQLSINGPAANNITYATKTSYTTTAEFTAAQTAYDTVTNPVTGGGAVRYPALIRGAFTTTAAGTFAVRYRSEVNASAVNILANSFCKISE